MSDSGKPQAAVDAALAPPVKPANQDVAALFTNLKLQHGHYQPFTRRQTAKQVPQIVEVPAPKPIMPRPAERVRTHLGFFSPAGGSGKSLFAASVASILCQLGKRVLLVDAAPWQTLAFHYGATEARAGRRTFFAPGLPKVPVHLLSCGDTHTSFPDLKDFDTENPVDYVLFDLSGVSGELLTAYLQECDRVLVPLVPDALASLVAASVARTLEAMGSSAPQAQFILNKMDDSDVAKEVQEALSRFIGKQLFPLAINYQPEVGKALHEGIVLPFYAPKAQASLVFGEFARSLIVPEKSRALATSRWIEA